MRFLLVEQWLILDRQRLSVADLVRAAVADTTLTPPEVRPFLFGYPEGSPQVGLPAALLDQVVSPENSAAHDWLGRHGSDRLLELVHRLGREESPHPTIVRMAGQDYTLSSPCRQASHASPCLLESRDEVQVDPSYPPLLALGTVVHEWVHIALEGRRLALTGPGAAITWRGRALLYTPPGRYVAEGFSEYITQRVLDTLATRFPLLRAGEMEKRASLAAGRGNDPHVLGYAMVSAAARNVSPARLPPLMARYASNPGGLLREPPFSSRWARYRGAPDVVVPFEPDLALIPELRFSVEDNYPEIIQTRILLP